MVHAVPIHNTRASCIRPGPRNLECAVIYYYQDTSTEGVDIYLCDGNTSEQIDGLEKITYNHFALQVSSRENITRVLVIFLLLLPDDLSDLCIYIYIK